MNNQSPPHTLTFETIMAALEKTDRILSEKFAETDRMQKETGRLQRKTERLVKKHVAALEQQRKEKKEQDEKDEKRMKKMEKEMGSWKHNHGSFAEEYFYNSFLDDEQNFFGERFDKIRNQVHPITPTLEDEYDLVLYNHTSVAIIEVKFKAYLNDIAKTMKKAETFRILCPDYKDYKIYLGLASMSFYPELEKKCAEQGIAIIKQVGDSVVIFDEHLKVF